MRAVVLLMSLFLLGNLWIVDSVSAQGFEKIDSTLVELLINPEFHTDYEVRRAAIQHMVLLSRLVTLPDPQENRASKRSVAFFLKFLFGDPSEIDYTQIEDKLYIRMPKAYRPEFKSAILEFMKDVYTDVVSRWTSLGLQPPSGYVYVWFMTDLDDLYDEFKSERHIRAFAMPCRYLVVPYSIISEGLYYKLQQRLSLEGVPMSKSRTAIKKFIDEDFKQTFAHELTHVFINSNVGFAGLDGIDKWFHEGVAIWLSEDNGQLLSEEYKEYKQRIDFLRMKYGNDRFLKFVHDSVEARSVSQALRIHFNLSSETQLRDETGWWYVRLKVMEMILTLFVIIMLIVMFNRWRNRQSLSLCALSVISTVSFYYWGHGFINLWASSPLEITILNIIAITLISLTPIKIVDPVQRYYRPRLRVKLQSTLESLERAREAGAPLYSPDLFRKAESLLSQAEKAESMEQYRRGTQYTIEATVTANQAMISIDPAKAQMMMKEVENLYAQVRDAVERITKRLGAEHRIVVALTKKLDEFFNMIAREDIESARRRARSIIQVCVQIHEMEDLYVQARYTVNGVAQQLGAEHRIVVVLTKKLEEISTLMVLEDVESARYWAQSIIQACIQAPEVAKLYYQIEKTIEKLNRRSLMTERDLITFTILIHGLRDIRNDIDRIDFLNARTKAEIIIQLPHWKID